MSLDLHPTSSLNLSHVVTGFVPPCHWICSTSSLDLTHLSLWTCPTSSLDLTHLSLWTCPTSSLDLSHLITVVPSHDWTCFICLWTCPTSSLDLSHMSNLMTGLVPPHDWTCPTFSLDLTHLNLWTCPASSLDFVLTSARK